MSEVITSQLALSTAFLINSSRNINGEEIVKEGLELGFSALELNIEITQGMIEEIKREVVNKKIEIVSLHNFCPKLDFIPAGRDLLSAYQYSSTDPEERKKAIELTKRTIDYAVDLNAQAVVVHAGEVEIELNEDKLFSQFVRGRIDRGYLEQVKKEREERKKVYLENSLKSIEEIVNYAEKKKLRGNCLKIGLENRFFAHEIPNFEEIKLFLKNFADSLGYWHDTGHAEISVKLGLVGSHEDYLKEYSSRMVGIHLHDVVGFADHRAPGTGEIDFAFLAKYLLRKARMNSKMIKAVEAHRCSTVSGVKASIEYLRKIGIN